MSYQLTIEPLGATIEVQEGQTMLDAALRHGIYLQLIPGEPAPSRHRHATNVTAIPITTVAVLFTQT